MALCRASFANHPSRTSKECLFANHPSRTSKECLLTNHPSQASKECWFANPLPSPAVYLRVPQTPTTDPHAYPAPLFCRCRKHTGGPHCPPLLSICGCPKPPPQTPMHIQRPLFCSCWKHTGCKNFENFGPYIYTRQHGSAKGNTCKHGTTQRCICRFPHPAGECLGEQPRI